MVRHRETELITHAPIPVYDAVCAVPPRGVTFDTTATGSGGGWVVLMEFEGLYGEIGDSLFFIVAAITKGRGLRGTGNVVEFLHC